MVCSFRRLEKGGSAMRLSIDSFVPQHEKLLCIDSDGTVIDAMNVKHIRCHGKSFIEEWGLADHAKEVQDIWNDINLYEKTRGINRFLALDEMLTRMEGAYLHTDPEEWEDYRAWIKEGNLSNKSLQARIDTDSNPLLRKAMRWSKSLNEKIAALTPADKPPFENVREALEEAKGKVDLAVISSSNLSAITEEWNAYGLLDYLSVMTSQEIGTKDECIARMLEKGYKKENVLMIGDAYPDVDASASNGVWYYPILTRHEGESWAELKNVYLPMFLAGRYGEVQDELMSRFSRNFENKGE